MIIELQIKGVTTRLSMEQAHELYKELAPIFQEVYDPLAPTYPYPWWTGGPVPPFVVGDGPTTSGYSVPEPTVTTFT